MAALTFAAWVSFDIILAKFLSKVASIFDEMKKHVMSLNEEIVEIVEAEVNSNPVVISNKSRV